MTRHAVELYAVTASTQNVLNVVHQTLSRVLMVGIAGCRRCLHLQCLPVPREMPRQTVSAKRPFSSDADVETELLVTHF